MFGGHRSNALRGRKACILFGLCTVIVVALFHYRNLIPVFFNWQSTPPIPRLIWQIFLDPAGPLGDLKPARQSWSSLNPDHALTLIDESEVAFWIGNMLKHRPHLESVLHESTPLVLRADILPYILLAQYGGVYTDVDVQALKPISTWVPEEHKESTRLVVGIEYDRLGWDGRWPTLEHSVQLCQWTIMAAANHEVLWTVVDRAAYAVLDLADKQLTSLSGLDLADNQVVISTTGPGMWTAVIMGYLRKNFRADLRFGDLSNITQPTLFHDVLVLPINFLGTRQLHSGSIREGGPDALVRHRFKGSWKEDDPYVKWKTNRVR